MGLYTYLINQPNILQSLNMCYVTSLGSLHNHKAFHCRAIAVGVAPKLWMERVWPVAMETNCVHNLVKQFVFVGIIIRVKRYID